MNARIILLSLAIIGLALSGCEKSIDATEENGLAKEITNDLIPITVVSVDSFAVYLDRLPNDSLSILGAEIVVDTLKIYVEYPGGCDNHSFSLLAAGAIAESNPPQIITYLGHDAGNDSCDARINNLVMFNLQPIRAYFLPFSTDTWLDSVIIRLNGYETDWLKDRSMWWNY